MNVDPRVRVRRRVEDRMTQYAGKSVRVSGEANDLIGTIRDHMVFRQDEVARLELQFLLEECLSELDELGKAHA
ncbi:hypothetical protein JY440_05730 [Stenotrophomonas maltophilia]|uniref:hypothetical protein n=1 Tax=Stenotrophomonas maltophilia TaxID=40324 RepID=UPI0013DC7B5D|nr:MULTISPECIES: hypothetical protein [Stenotrophomonas]MBH1541848.1 hypothetical protein [Stenotrophomonas maltophilia]MBN4982721.1 hypothetical protein [Stenotrophomonas maltophilia]